MRTIDPNRQVHPRIAHYVLRVSDMAASLPWYQQVLSMEVVHSAGGRLVFLTYDDEHHRMALVETGEAERAPQGSAGLDHVAFTLDSLEDLLSNYKRLKAVGIEPVWPINHGLTTSMYYEDPDGNRVEFQVENYPTKEELNAFMHGEVFAANPIGVNFDPDDLVARYESGEDIQSLLQQPSA